MDILCRFFISSFRQDGSRSLESTETSGNGDTNNASMETGEHLNVDILRALSAVLFENGTLVKEVCILLPNGYLCSIAGD